MLHLSIFWSYASHFATPMFIRLKNNILATIDFFIRHRFLINVDQQTGLITRTRLQNAGITLEWFSHISGDLNAMSSNGNLRKTMEKTFAHLLDKIG